MNKATMQGLNKRLSSHTGITLRIMVAAVLLLTFVLGTVSLAAPNAPTGESSLGDRVWHDLNNNSVQETGEPGIDGVHITVYVDNPTSGIQGQLDPTDTLENETPPKTGKMTTTTNAAGVDGYYNYNKITAAGNEFFVVIDADNFAPGGALEGFLFSSELISFYEVRGEPGNAANPLHLYVPTAPTDFRVTLDEADFGFWKPELSLSITPGTATNEVGDPHEFVVTVKERAASGANVGNMVPKQGAKPVVTVTNSANFAITPIANAAGKPRCSDGTNSNGQCWVTINSTTADVYTAKASLSETYGTGGVNGTVTLNRTTGVAPNLPAPSGNGGTGNAAKTYVDLRIKLSPLTPTNEVGVPHTFTASLEWDLGKGAGWVAVPTATQIGFSLPNNTANGAFTAANTCTTSTAALTLGQCEITINGAQAGAVDVQATVSITNMNGTGVDITRTTGVAPNIPALGGNGGTGNATKTYVNLRIKLDPLTPTNPVFQPHTFTASLEWNLGKGAGWVAVPTATQIGFLLLNNTAGGTFTAGNTCTTSTAALTLGQCEITINGAQAGAVDVQATVSITNMNGTGVDITRTTGVAPNLPAPGGNDGTGNATKTYLAATLGDKVWWDIDKDGIQDGGEPGIEDVTVNLYVGSSTTVYSTTQTNASGIYQFQNLPNNTYRIEIPAAEFTGNQTLVNWKPSPLNNPATTDELDSDADPVTHAINSVALGVGATDNSRDFGFYMDTDYTITKTTNAVGSQRLGDEIKFTIQIKNLGASYLAVVPLEDTYNTRYLTYQRAEVGGVALVADGGLPNSGTLTWNDVTSATATGQLAPNATISIDVFFNAAGDTTDASVIPTNPDWPNTKNVAKVVNPKGDPDGPTGPLPEDEPLPTKQDDALVQIINPTAVSVASSTLAVDPANGTVTMRWQTVSEADIAGFHVIRRVDGGAPEQINDQLILAQNPGQPVGSWYTFMDGHASVGSSTTYLLQFIMADGRVVNHELDTVFVGYTLYMPLVIR